MTSTLVLSSAFVALATLYYLKSKRIQNHPPLFKSTSFFSFVLGALPDIIHFQSKQALPDFFVQLNKSDLLCLLEIPGKTIISVARPDVIKSVLTRQNDFKRDALLQNMFQGIGTWSLFVIPTNDVWFRHRKLLQPAFGPTHLKYGFECTNLCFNVLAKSWHGLLKNNSVTVDIHKHLACMTLDIIGKVAFSYEFNLAANVHDFNLPMFHVLENLDKIIDVAQKRFRPRILWFLSGLETFQIKKETDSVLGCIKSVIASKKEQNLKNPDLLKDKKKLDVLDRLLLSEDDSEKPFNDEELKDEVFAFIGAGHETTTNSLTWIILALDQNPSSLLKMIAEIDSVLKPNHDLSFEDLSLLHYTEFVIKESMRMSPVVPFFGKYATKDTDLGEYKIKKDTTVFLNCLSVHLNPLYWDNATKFIPERWENGFVPIAGSYVPFGDGLTNCIGQKLAMIEMKVILARLYSQFNVEVVEGQDLTPVCSLTRGLKRGLKVILSPRNN